MHGTTFKAWNVSHKLLTVVIQAVSSLSAQLPLSPALKGSRVKALWHSVIWRTLLLEFPEHSRAMRKTSLHRRDLAKGTALVPGYSRLWSEGDTTLFLKREIRNHTLVWFLMFHPRWGGRQAGCSAAVPLGWSFPKLVWREAACCVCVSGGTPTIWSFHRSFMVRKVEHLLSFI